MDGLEVMSFAITAMSVTIKDLLKTMNWTKDDVKIFALHQANKSIMTAIIRRFRIPAEKVPITLTRYGNTAGASIPLILCFEYSRQSQICSGRYDKAILSGFGNGLACASAAIDLSRTHFCKIYEL